MGRVFPKPKINHETGMNKTETRYADFLNSRLIHGEILDYKFEPIKFRLAKKTFYTPDFLVICHGHFEVHEVKGFWRDDARVKIKVAAQMYPHFVWKAVQYKQKQWVYEVF